jgi:hypothetical protein
MSTKQRVSKDVNKHPSSIEGKQKKRRRSSKDLIENKREKLEFSTSSDSSDNEGITMANQAEAATSSGRSLGADIRAEIVSALGDQNIIEMLSKAFAKQIVQDLKTEVDELKQQGAETKKRMDTFDSRLDKIEQKERENNVVATGIPSDKISKDEVRKILNKKLNCNVSTLIFSTHWSSTKMMKQ